MDEKGKPSSEDDITLAQALADINNRVPDEDGYFKSAIVFCVGSFVGAAITVNLPQSVREGGAILIIVPVLAIIFSFFAWKWLQIRNRISRNKHLRKLKSRKRN